MISKKTREEIEKLEKQLHKISDKLYDLNVEGRRIHPVYPYLLCRVMPKEHMSSGGILLPETSQNKPVYEFLVIATWRPWDEVRKVWKPEWALNGPTDMTIHHESAFKPGDRIAAPHFEGISMHGYLDEKYYRLIREVADQKNLPYCGVLGKIDYDGDVEISNQIRELSAKLYSVTTSGIPISRGDTPPVVESPA